LLTTLTDRIEQWIRRIPHFIHFRRLRTSLLKSEFVMHH